jgi:hypothetical protein
MKLRANLVIFKNSHRAAGNRARGVPYRTVDLTGTELVHQARVAPARGIS